MRIYISVDMEGCSGVLHREHTSPHGYDYEIARRLMTQEANSAIGGAFDAGATEVVVSDSHGGNGFRSLLLEELDERADAIVGGPRRLGQLEGIDAGFDGLMLVGYHTRHGRSGVLSHTTNGQAVANLWIEGQIVGEIGLNCLLAAHHGVPTILVTGDGHTAEEAKIAAPSCETVVVKTAVSRYAAKCMHPKRARFAIREGARAAVERIPEMDLVRQGSDVHMRLQFKETGSAESAARLPQVRLIEDDTIEFTCANMDDAYGLYSAAVELWIPAWGAWIAS